MSYSPKMGAIIYVLWLVVTSRERERERRNGYCISRSKRLTFQTHLLVAGLFDIESPF